MPDQKVFRLPSKGAGVDALQETTEPIPKAQAHEVVLKIHASTLNFRDLVIATGLYPFPVKDNAVPLSDAAGTIEEVGPGVFGFENGDFAIANFDPTNQFGPQRDWENALGGPVDGVCRPYVALPASCIVKIPKNYEAIMAPARRSRTTAWNALYGNLPLKAGQTVLFQGTGGVSMTGLMLAKAAGAKTIITSSSDEKLKFAREKYGADFTINYKKTPKWGEAALELTNGQGVDYVFENGGAGTIAESIKCVARGGQIAVIGFLAQIDQKDMPDVAALVLDKGCIVRGINVGAKQLTEDMVQLVCSKDLAMPIDKTYKFELQEIKAAYKELSKAGHVGKIAIHIQR
ncbi:Zinc-type alcohol dehydrogenase-like protein, partial [Pseudocercospora fuligena]